MSDNVSHPSHYCQGDIECIDAIKAATIGKTGIEAVCVANIIKYLWRYENKNGLEDVRKSAWYVNRLIQELEAKNDKSSNKYNEDEYSCDSCKYDALGMASYDPETDKCTKEPCKSCKCNFIYGTDEYEEAPLNYEPEEN